MTIKELSRHTHQQPKLGHFFIFGQEDVCLQEDRISDRIMSGQDVRRLRDDH